MNIFNKVLISEAGRNIAHGWGFGKSKPEVEFEQWQHVSFRISKGTMQENERIGELHLCGSFRSERTKMFHNRSGYEICRSSSSSPNPHNARHPFCKTNVKSATVRIFQTHCQWANQDAVRTQRNINANRLNNETVPKKQGFPVGFVALSAGFWQHHRSRDERRWVNVFGLALCKAYARLAVLQNATTICVDGDSWEYLDEDVQVEDVADMYVAVSSSKLVFATATTWSKSDIHGERILTGSALRYEGPCLSGSMNMK